MEFEIFKIDSSESQEQIKSNITQVKDCNPVSCSSELTSELKPSDLTSARRPLTRPRYIFVIQLHNGKFVIGQGNNPAKRIASINSGYNMLVRGSLQVNRIVGIRDQNESRTFSGVVKSFCERYGEDIVIAV